MRVVAATVSRMARLSASLFRGGRDFLRIEQIVGTVALGRLLLLATKELVLNSADLPPRLAKFLLQLRDPLHGVGMSAFPIAHFPAKIGPQLLQRSLQTLDSRAVRTANRGLGRLGRKVQKRGIHRATLQPDWPSQTRSISPPIDKDFLIGSAMRKALSIGANSSESTSYGVFGLLGAPKWAKLSPTPSGVAQSLNRPGKT
jgi:hypothetical protein